MNVEELTTESISGLPVSYRRRFDSILLSDVVEKVPDPGLLLKKVSSALRPNGRIVISAGNIAIWFYRLSLLLGRFNYGQKGPLDRTSIHLFTPNTLKQLVASSGLQICSVHYANIPFELVFESPKRTLTNRILDWAYRGLVLLWPNLFAYQTIIEAKLGSFDAAQGEGEISPEDSLAV